MEVPRHNAGRSPTRSVSLAVVLAALVACAGPQGTTAPNTQELSVDSLVLAPGQEALVQTLRLSFLRVAQDSRCPVDAVCVWQGDAAVTIALGLGTGPVYPFTLHTTEGTSTAEFGGYRVTLLGLLPDPLAGVGIPQEAYEAGFRVETPD